jgi:prephenate dehydrogenase
MANREALVAMLDRYMGDLTEIRQAIERGDAPALLEIFTRAKAARDRFCG